LAPGYLRWTLFAEDIAMTTQSIFWRLVWKEYRLQRALWISMAALAAIVLLVDLLALDARDLRMVLWMAATMPAFYCLGCGAMLFAGEREAGVYEFQRSLPLGAGRLFAAKIAFALTSMAALFSLMWLLALWLCRTMPTSIVQSSDNYAVLAGVVVFGVGMFLWATLFSLLLKHVLAAAVLGVAAASIHFELLSNLFGVLHGRLSTLSGLLVLTVGVIAADCWLGIRWFCEKTDRRARAAAVQSPLARPTGEGLGVRADRMAMLGRLVWQHFRQSIGTMSAVGGAIVSLAVVPAGALYWNTLPKPGYSEWWGKPLFALALMCVPLLGVCTFLADQRGRSYRVLADRGVSPRYVWLSRQLVALLPVVVVLPIFLFIAATNALECYYPHFGVIRDTWGTVVSVLAQFVVAVAVGQACSMLFRSGILAGVFAVLSGVVLAVWCWLMLFWNVPWQWSILPIPVALLLATRLRTRDWLVERNTLRSWLLPTIVLVVPAVALLAAVPLYRIYQIPVVDPGFAVESYNRPMTVEERATLDLYERAWQSYQSSPDSGSSAKNGRETPMDELGVVVMPNGKTIPLPEWVDARREAIVLVTRASRGRLFDPNSRLRHPERVFTLANMMVRNAAVLQRQGRLDAALEQYLAAIRIAAQYRKWCQIRVGFSGYSADSFERNIYGQLPYWAACPKQTPKRILAAMQRLEKVERIARASDDGPIKLQYLILKRILNGDVEAIYTATSLKENYVAPFTKLWLRLPWEKARALRWLDYQTHYGLKGDWGDWPWLAAQLVSNNATINGQIEGQVTVERLRAGELLFNLEREINFLPYQADPISWQAGQFKLEQERLDTETARRATQVVLALEAWKLRHGSLPKELGELVGPCLDKMPLDPRASQPFRYFRDGVKIPLNWRQPQYSMSASPRPETLPAGVPFIWSRGANVRRDESAWGHTIFDEYWLRTIDGDWPRRAVWRRPLSEIDIWESGWPFPVP